MTPQPTANSVISFSERLIKLPYASNKDLYKSKPHLNISHILLLCQKSRLPLRIYHVERLCIHLNIYYEPALYHFLNYKSYSFCFLLNKKFIISSIFFNANNLAFIITFIIHIY